MAERVVQQVPDTKVPVPQRPPDFATLLEALAKLIPWIILLIALVWFHPEISDLLKRTKGFKGLGLEWTVFEGNIKPAVGRGQAAPNEQLSPLAKLAWKKYQDLGEVLPLARILWVDDNPQNNFTMRRNLTSYGIQVDIAISNAEAIDAVLRRDYHMIISDVGRDNAEPVSDGMNKDAGLDLAKKVANIGYKAPILFYTYSPSKVTSDIPHLIATGSGSLLLNTIADVLTVEFKAAPAASDSAVGSKK